MEDTGRGTAMGADEGSPRRGVRVDYHFHTQFSYDSRTTPAEVLARAAETGLTVLCVTDHDTVAGAEKLAAAARAPLEVIIGCEFTCDDGSHVIGIGLADMIGQKRPLALMERIRDQGGLVLLPHLFRRGSGLFRNDARRTEGFVRDALALADMVECFNGRDTYENNARSRRFAAERGLPSVAGSDAHHPGEIGSVFVEYDAPHPVHGASARRVFFPPQRVASEHPVMRAALELYHRHKAGLPRVVRDTYRLARAALKRDLPRYADPRPCLQYHLAAQEPPRGLRQA